MRQKPLFFAALVILIVAMGCNLSIPTTGNPSEPIGSPEQQATIVALAAQMTATQIYVEQQLGQILTQTAQAPLASATLPPTLPEQPTATASPEPPMATQTPVIPTATITPMVPTSIPATATPVVVIPTATPIPCNAAAFVKDVTVTDGSVIPAGASFTKTWRLLNTGSCSWTNQYDVIYVDGTNMGMIAADMPASVKPGSQVDVSVTLNAPAKAGAYRSNWKLRAADGTIFGVGGRSASFYADIKVDTGISSYPYDFALNYCAAEWTSGAGTLACPSPEGDSKGWVVRRDAPKLETGQIDNEPALITNPQALTDGVIRGKFPFHRVEAGEHFRALIGCERDAKTCDVTFQLEYIVSGGSIQTLATWREFYDEKINSVDVDLSSFAGKDVQFVLTALANGTMSEDRAMWLAPRIEK